MDFSFSARDLAFADEARAGLEANVPAAWHHDHSRRVIVQASNQVSP